MFKFLEFLGKALWVLYKGSGNASLQTTLGSGYDNVAWSNKKREEIVNNARSQLGKPYVLGAEVQIDDPSPKAFDCSELVEWAFRKAGVEIPDGCDAQFRFTAPVDKPQLGDMGFLRYKSPKSGLTVWHVILCSGEGTCINATLSKGGVVEETSGRFLSHEGWIGWQAHPEFYRPIGGL